MKKHNNILSEVTHIKHLMGLREYSHADCEEQLEDAGYLVFNRSELRSRNVGCEVHPNLKCVKDWLISKGIDETEIIIKKHTNNNCYLMHTIGTVDLDGTDYPKQNWVFWQSGKLALINSFDELKEDTVKSKFYAQYQYDGKYVCSGGDLTWKDLEYTGVYDSNNKKRLITSFPKKDWEVPNTDDGTGNKLKILSIVSTLLFN